MEKSSSNMLNIAGLHVSEARGHFHLIQGSAERMKQHSIAVERTQTLEILTKINKNCLILDKITLLSPGFTMRRIQQH